MLDISVSFKSGTTEAQALESLLKLGAVSAEKTYPEVYTVVVTEEQLEALKLDPLVKEIDIDGNTDIDKQE